MKNLKVTYKAVYKVGKQTKVSQWTEMHASEFDAKLRAQALNWEIVSIEVVA